MEEKRKLLSRIITTVEIEALMREGLNGEAYNQLNTLLEKEPKNAYGWYLLGTLFRRQQMWGEAINAYNKSKLLEPEGPAAAAVDSVYEILNYKNGGSSN